MEKMLGICGIMCTECPAYLATQKDDDAERKRVAEMWSKKYNATIKAEDINCDGCISDGRHFGHCSQCEIRKCGMEKKVKNCAYCDQYACETLTKFFEWVPEAKTRLDEINRNM